MSDHRAMQEAFDAAIRAARAGADAATPYLDRALNSHRKADGSLVTEADQAAERAVIDSIRRTHPDDAILTEETGAHEGRTGARWIVDPIDGTHRFARGMRFWGPMVALELDGEIVAGAVALPTLGETYAAARGLGAFRNGEPIRVSTVRDWTEANLSCGSLARLFRAGYTERVTRLIERCDYCFAGGDLEGGAMVARGEAEAWIEYGVKPWDVAPYKVIVEEAGGLFTDFSGGFDLNAEGFIASNGLMHEDALRALRG